MESTAATRSWLRISGIRGIAPSPSDHPSRPRLSQQEEHRRSEDMAFSHLGRRKGPSLRQSTWLFLLGSFVEVRGPSPLGEVESRLRFRGCNAPRYTRSRSARGKPVRFVK